ncbi:MAG: efflux RND transporter periplasmic adaptor subunit [Candidatus Competibacteraceae bacterium]|jgi:membrane fusion protein (multidrug efflux system)|nr:efflux RND transporter periplasmic adaptor subunit [Candidatus Competibacteraceae bacterium]
MTASQSISSVLTLFLSLIVSSVLSPVLAARPPTPVIVAEASIQPIDDRVEALGTLRANESVNLTASVTETVTAIHFDDGDTVPAGKILLEMTSAEEHALLKEAQSLVTEARSQFQRVQSLATRGTASRSLLDERRREWETARARLTGIESRLADRLVKAPFAGVLGLRNISLGALVEPGDVITTLDDIDLMKLEFPVPSTFLETLQTGLSITAKARAYGDREFVGKVTSIDSRVDPVTRSILVRAVLPNPNRILKPGLLMRVELLKNPRDAVVIPESALVPLGQAQYVLIVDESQDNLVERREIQTGTRRPGEVEVISGLQAGNKVITHGTTRVRPGQNVVIQAVDDGTQDLQAMLNGSADGEAQP